MTPVIDLSTPCQPWSGPTHSTGYGVVNLGHRGMRDYAHRVAYEALYGPIPAGMVLDHVCHSEDRACAGGSACQHRRCINTAHLEVVTRDENLRRGRAERSHCQRGHRFAPRSGSDRRRCLECQRERHTAYMRGYNAARRAA